MSASSATGTTYSLSIPDIGSLSDEEMTKLFPLADGRWSPQTKEMLARHGTTKLSLNGAWASTWRDWACPCCRRSKRDIARVTDAGVLLCQLDWHHDHLEDYARKLIIGMARPVRSAEPADGEVDRIVQIDQREQIIPLFRRFEPILVCHDCNLADAQAKQALRREVDRDFSFTPTEIRSFIEIAPNRLHEIDIQKAWQAMLAADEEFHELMHFARFMGERLAQGRHRKEVARSQEFMTRRGAEMRAIIHSQCPGLSDYDLEQQFLERSRSSDGKGTSLREKVKKPGGVAPSAYEFAQIDSKNTETCKKWAAASDGWRCDACGRSKFEITRKSGKNAWLAKIHAITDYDAQFDVHDESGAMIEIAGFSQVTICHDCRIISTQVKQKLKISGSDCLTLEDLKTLTRDAVPHRMHDYDTRQAIAMAEGNAPLREAIQQFKEERQRHMDLLSMIERQVGRHVSQETKAQALAARLCEGDWAASDAGPAAARIIANGERQREMGYPLA